MANRTRSKKRSKNKKSKKMYMQRGGVFTQEEKASFAGIQPDIIDVWSNSSIDYSFFPPAIQQYNEAIEQSIQAINDFQANSTQNIINIADKIRQNTPMNVNELMIQIVSPPGSPVSVASSRMNEGGRRRRKTRKMIKQRGGMRYGTGVGSNCFEPNYSIYNTPALTLFPYKPN
jgi:hypothetical protein